MRRGEESQEEGALEHVAQSLVNSKKPSLQKLPSAGPGTLAYVSSSPQGVLASCSQGQSLRSFLQGSEGKPSGEGPESLLFARVGEGAGGYD